MKKSIILSCLCLGLLILARALPTGGVLPDAKAGTQYVFITNVLVVSNFVYVYPKATNWINVVNWPTNTVLEVPDLYLPPLKTWLTN